MEVSSAAASAEAECCLPETVFAWAAGKICAKHGPEFSVSPSAATEAAIRQRLLGENDEDSTTGGLLGLIGAGDCAATTYAEAA
jgi:hypothetical protein